MPDKPQTPKCPSASALSAALYLMSRIALRGGASPLSPLVMEHLALLSLDPCVHPTVRLTTRRLFGEWQRVAKPAHGGPADCGDANALMHEAIRRAMS
jgi:hypothetical protein